MVAAILASCKTPPSGQPFECNDVVYPSLLRPALAVLLGIFIAGLVTYWRRRGREEISSERRGLLGLLVFISAAANTTAAWAGTHEFAVFMAGNGAHCTAVGGATREFIPPNPVMGHCLLVARSAWAVSMVAAAASLGLLVFVARGSRRPRGEVIDGPIEPSLRR